MPAVSELEAKRFVEMYESGDSIARIASTFRRSKETVYRWIKNTCGTRCYSESHRLSNNRIHHFDLRAFNGPDNSCRSSRKYDIARRFL